MRPGRVGWGTFHNEKEGDSRRRKSRILISLCVLRTVQRSINPFNPFLLSNPKFSNFSSIISACQAYHKILSFVHFVSFHNLLLLTCSARSQQGKPRNDEKGFGRGKVATTLN